MTSEALLAKILALYLSSLVALRPQAVRKPKTQTSPFGEHGTEIYAGPKTVKRKRSWPTHCCASSNHFLIIATLERPGARAAQPSSSLNC